MIERSDIVALGEDIFGDIIAHPPRDADRYIVRVTSGTSGSAPLVIPTGYPPEAPADMAGKDGLERVVSCSGSLCARLANALIVSRIPEGNVMQVLPIDVRDLSPDLEALLSDFRPEVLYGSCSSIMRVSEYTTPRVCGGIRRVMFVGELFSSFSEQFFNKRFPNAGYAELYIASEAGGYVGTRLCRHLPRNHFHTARGVTVDILEPDEAGVGEILVSKTIFRNVRLEKYRIGDIGRMVAAVCPCGATGTFELLGRGGTDYLKLAGAILRREEFDRVAALFAPLIHDYRVEARQVLESGKTKGEITLYIFYRGGTFTDALVREVGEKFARNLFLTPTKTLATLVFEGAFKPLTTKFSDGPFVRGHKDVKLMLHR